MKEEERAIVLENENTNVEPIPVGTGGGKPQPEMDALSSIVKDFNDTYGNIEWKNFCNAIHADEENPELMFQNYDAFPRKWYDESSFDEDSFNTVKDYSDLCDKYSPDAVEALHNQGCGSAMLMQAQHCAHLALDFIDWGCEELERFEDCYVGEWDSEEDFARHIIDECYNLESEMGDLTRYFDYESLRMRPVHVRLLDGCQQ